MTEVIVWSGWVGGIGVGLYGLFQLLLSGKPLGVSTGYGNVCRLFSRVSFFKKNEYSKENSWRAWFLVGLPLGGLLAALTSPGEIALSFSLGELYDSVFPQALWAKGLILTIGGILIGYGARAAGGCTSGHSITGLALLNPPSLLASAGFFVGGIIMVQLMFTFM